MGTWGTSIKDNDAFADIYSEFFDQYNKGAEPHAISEKIINDNWEILEIEEEKNSLWFALGLALWETNSLNPQILNKIEKIIESGEELKIWLDLGASAGDIKKRRISLEKFIDKLRTNRPKPKPRKKAKLKTPVFSTGDCISFKLDNGNFGAAIVLASDQNPETAYNLVATTRVNSSTKPTLDDIRNSEVLVLNFASWEDKVEVTWYMPDLYFKNYSMLYEVIGQIDIDFEYDVKNWSGKGYHFKPTFTSGWNMNEMMDKQLKSEKTKPQPLKSLYVKKLIKKDKFWTLW
ncbi:hypothetical protein ACFE6N_12470 [Pedobacter sp. BG31]|uniref:hypothetical protein n=1 Tax=Pedobacter sp. BG31 TaxID=3349697 RepID=UPI0035F25767